MSVEVIGRRRSDDPWLAFRRRFIYPFGWFYRSHIWGLRYRLKYVRLFASAVWHWDTCDYAPTLELMHIAFREMSRLHKHHGHHVTAEKKARQLLIVSELCRRLQRDDYAELAGYARYDNMSERQRRHWSKHLNYLAEQDVAYLGKTLRHLRYWWN